MGTRQGRRSLCSRCIPGHAQADRAACQEVTHESDSRGSGKITQQCECRGRLLRLYIGQRLPAQSNGDKNLLNYLWASRLSTGNSDTSFAKRNVCVMAMLVAR